ncbi:hypothetical protein CMV_027557 [Castanea mollissima]|uniref:Uncharacterized protein n=1 Tax=Castanea mollissima TaxID=60419 RepID=A0A8J4QBI8_9ROSI|nr:hypothetical protein CMV_027557 [Castanea mollissima]
MGREIVRQESPNILETRSRLWYYKDAREVLTGSKGSDKIRELKYLPNGLKILEWHKYPFPLPSNYFPQQLVVLKMPHSCIRLEKLFKQGRQYNNLRSINLGRITLRLQLKSSNYFKTSSSDDPKITWWGVHVDCICCGSSSVPDDIDHHSFPSDVGLQIARICDNTEPPPLPAIFSTPYGSDFDHGVSNTGGVSGLLIDPNFESSFHDDVHDLDSSSIAYPFARIGYLDSNASIDGFSPLVLDDIEHHSLPSDVRPVDTTNGSELSLGRQDLGFSDGFDQGSSSVAHAFDNNNSDFNLFPPSKKARTS